MKVFKNLIVEIEQKLATRLKPPYVSKEYTKEDKENLLKGIKLAIKNGIDKTKKLSSTQIIELFNTMNPQVRAKMKQELRRSPVAFLIDDVTKCTKQGWVEFLNLAENFKGAIGPQFEIYDTKNKTKEHFKSLSEMLQFYKCTSNSELVDLLYENLTNSTYKMRFIPTYDCMNPFCDRDPKNEQEMQMLFYMADQLKACPINDDISPMFNNLISEFNKIQSPSISDISLFIKKMILLHPFHDGNGRTFTLGVLNQLLIKHNYGYCLNLDPRIPIMSLKELEENINKNLIKLPENFCIDLSEEQDLDLLKRFHDEKCRQPN